jgi:hypothetical protein
MPHLPGVLEALDEMCVWAKKRYDVVSIDDRREMVTIERIRARLTPDDSAGEPDPSLLLERPRIVVYFCGHGITAWPDQYWVLSKGPDQSMERISANAFRDALASYDPRQIALISDSCRTAQPLTGSGTSVLDILPGASRNPQKDTFYSCRDGTSSYAVPPADGRPGYLVFTSVFLKAVSKPDGTNLDRTLLQLNRRAVTSQSLSDYIEEKVPVQALGVDRIQAAQCDPGFRPLDHIYEEFATPMAGLIDPGDLGSDELDEDNVTEPLPPLAGHHDISAIQGYIVKNFAISERKRLSRQALRFDAPVFDWRTPIVRRVSDMLRERASYDETLAVVGVDRPQLLLRGGSSIRLSNLADDPSVSFLIPPQHLRSADRNETLCLKLDYRTICFVPLFRNMHAIAVAGKSAGRRQIEFLSWISIYGDEEREHLIHSARALDSLTKGQLRASDAARLAGQIRYTKHLDPMMGVIAAYLYNAAGDIENIRRMAYFYARYRQPIPFDIAMLGNLPMIQAKGGFVTEVPSVPATANLGEDLPQFTHMTTEAVNGSIAGVSPFLRIGWPYLYDSGHPFHKACWEQIDRLGPSPITTFVGKRAVLTVANAFGELF